MKWRNHENTKPFPAAGAATLRRRAGRRLRDNARRQQPDLRAQQQLKFDQ